MGNKKSVIKKFEMVDSIISKILNEHFIVKRDYPSEDFENKVVVNYTIYEDESKLKYERITFIYTFKPLTIEVVYKKYESECLKVIVIPKTKTIKDRKYLEQLLRRELDDVIDPILRKHKVLKAIKETLKQQYNLELDNCKIKMLYIDDYKVRVKLSIINTELVIEFSYLWNSENKMVVELNITSIEVYTNKDKTLCDLVFNAVHSYYLLTY